MAKAWIDLVHSCGHENRVFDSTGPATVRFHTTRAAASPCDECAKKMRQERYAAESATAAAETADMVALEGSEKQIAWATTIRATAVNLVKQGLQEEFGEDIPEKATRAVELFHSQKKSSWWIDRKRNGQDWWMDEVASIYHSLAT